MITRNTIRFKCPVQGVPTKDNVRVSLDVGINFHIGKTEKSQDNFCQKFFYNFGPNRLEELLQEECDEGIRDFIKKIKVIRVRDVKTELTSVLKQELQNKFDSYGVVIEQVNIMNVIIPQDLRMTLMQATNYDVQLQNQVKAQENKILILTNSENKEVLKLKRDNMQQLFALQHLKDVEEINLLETEIEQETHQIEKSILAHLNQSTKTIEANNIKTLAEKKAQTIRTKLIKNAEAFKEKQTLLANTEAEMIRANANARLSVAKDKSALLIKESVAEANAQENMNPLRKHAEKMKLNQALKTMSSNANIVLSGKNGQSLLDFYNNTITEISGR